jgi:hypothetical protein
VTPIRSATCERTRSYVSLRLDGELAELERRMLDAHLGGCAGCRAFAGEVEAITRAVRAAPLAHVGRPVAARLQRARARTGALRHVAAVAAGVFVVLGAGSAAERGGETPERRGQSPAVWPMPKAYLSEAALREEQSLMALTRPGTPLPQLRF